MGRFKSFDEFLDLFPTRPRQKIEHGYNVLCPAHNDRNPSLSVSKISDKILLHCNAGCPTPQILAKLNLSAGDLFLINSQTRTEKAIYKYHDAKRQLLFEVVRYTPKAFKQRRPDGRGGYIWNLKGIAPVLYHLPDITNAITRGDAIYITEGEKDADALVSLGLVATTNAMGAGKWRDCYSNALRDADVVIIPDADAPGRKHASEVAASCYGKAESIKMLELQDAKDITDWLERGHTAEELRQLIDNCPLYELPEKPADKPVIVVRNRQLRDETVQVLDALYGTNDQPPQVFQRTCQLVRVLIDDKGTAYTDMLDETSLRSICTRKADFQQVSKEGDRSGVRPPLDVMRDVLILKEWKFPNLVGVSSVPVIRKDGSVLVRPGYDVDTGLYYHSDLSIPPISTNPSENDVRVAVELIREVLYDFPFDSVGSRANAVAALVTPVIRPLIDGVVPLAVIDKPQAGTGASMICDVIAVVATGKPAAMMGGYKDDTEWRKCITTTLMRGHAVVVIDNVDGELYAASLATLLTTSVWKDRVLGRNEDVLLPNTACWLANGNNIKLKGDLPRRAYWIRLDAQEAQPWLRRPSMFRHPHLISWVKEHRGAILAAILTVARAWVLAGMPRPSDPVVIGSFERWSETIGGLLEYVGLSGFLTNLQEMYARTDSETPVWELFLEAWLSSLGDKPVTVSEVANKAKDEPRFEEVIPPNLGSVEDKGFTRKLGNALSKREGMRFSNQLMIKRSGEAQRANRWVITKAQGSKLGDLSFRSEFGEFAPTSWGVEKQGKATSSEEENTKRLAAELDSQNSPLASKGVSPASGDGALIEFWDSLGRPEIRLGSCEVCEDLRRLLGNANLLPRHRKAVMNWAEQEGWESPEQEPETRGI